MKERLDKTQQNSKCRLWDERNETITYRVSEGCKLAQRGHRLAMTRKAKLSTLKFDHTNKWYMQNPESVLENDTHKLHWYFEISARRPDHAIINIKERPRKIKDFAVLADHRVE